MAATIALLRDESGQSFLAAAARAAHELGGDRTLSARMQKKQKNKGRRKENKMEAWEKSSSRLQNQMSGCLRPWEFVIP